MSSACYSHTKVVVIVLVDEVVTVRHVVEVHVIVLGVHLAVIVIILPPPLAPRASRAAGFPRAAVEIDNRTSRSDCILYQSECIDTEIQRNDRIPGHRGRCGIYIYGTNLSAEF